MAISTKYIVGHDANPKIERREGKYREELLRLGSNRGGAGGGGGGGSSLDAGGGGGGTASSDSDSDASGGV